MSLNTIFDNGTHTIQSAGVEAAPQPVTKITKLAFKQRLTQAERIAIRSAAQSSPEVFDFQDLVDSATYIDLSRTDTRDGVNQLETAGLLATGRASEILDNPVEPQEVYRGF